MVNTQQSRHLICEGCCKENTISRKVKKKTWSAAGERNQRSGDLFDKHRSIKTIWSSRAKTKPLLKDIPQINKLRGCLGRKETLRAGVTVP